MRRRWVTWERVHGVSRSGRLILLALSEIADASGRCRPTMQHLVDRSGLHSRTIQRHVLALETRGLLLRRIGGGAYASTYQLIKPDQHAPQDGGQAVTHV